MLHFDSSECIIWISFLNLDKHECRNSFIKFGYSERLERNLIAHFGPLHEDAFKSISIDTISIDSIVDVVESICFIDPFVKDFEQFVFEPKQKILTEDHNKYYKSEEILPELLQHSDLDKLNLEKF